MEERVEKEMLEKYAEILAAAVQPTLKDHIIRQCKLNSSSFAIYTKRLIQNGLLKTSKPNLRLPGSPSENRMLYQTTEKGLEFLKRYKALMALMETPTQITLPYRKT